MKKQAPGLSDATLFALWRKAVLKRCGKQCRICGQGGYLECHHVIHKRYKLLRWDHRNGVPVHHGDCHSTADKIGMSVAGPEFYSYLLDQVRLTFKQYLMDMKLSETEWREQVKADLLLAIGGSA